MTRPSFFIAGAPKCGTTSMYHYLNTHPNVFMPDEKEPHYFSTDMPVYRRMETEEEYLKLFSTAGPMHLAIGESSVWYLYSRDALPLIRDFNPESRIVVFFRNPVDFVQSMHAQFAYNNGLRPDFPNAWVNAKKRSRLIAQGSFGKQYGRLIGIFPPEQVHVALLEDLRSHPRREYLRALEFLELEDDDRTDFITHNAHKVHRSPWLARFAKRTPLPLENSWKKIKRFTGIQKLGMMERILSLNTKPVKREAIDPALRESIYEAFAEDIDLLSRMINRDLSHWR